MDIFKDVQQELGCSYVSDLPRLFRAYPHSFVFVLLPLTFRQYPISQWIDLFNYLQIPFEEESVTNMGQIRAILNQQKNNHNHF